MWIGMSLSAEETRIGHEQMAKDPCGLGPFPLVPAHAEQVDEPVQVGLEVGLLHARESEEVAPEPRAQVAHEPHRPQVNRVGGVGLVGLVGALGGLHGRGVRPLLAVHDERAGRYVGEQRVLDPLGGGLAVPAGHDDRVLERVDRDGDAGLVLGQALFWTKRAPRTMSESVR